MHAYIYEGKAMERRVVHDRVNKLTRRWLYNQNRKHTFVNKVNMWFTTVNINWCDISLWRLVTDTGRHDISVGRMVTDMGGHDIIVGRMITDTGRHDISVGRMVTDTGRTFERRR